MKKQVGMNLNGVLFKSNGEDLTWSEFIEAIESAGLNFAGITESVDEEGLALKQSEWHE